MSEKQESNRRDAETPRKAQRRKFHFNFVLGAFLGVSASRRLHFGCGATGLGLRAFVVHLFLSFWKLIELPINLLTEQKFVSKRQQRIPIAGDHAMRAIRPAHAELIGFAK